MNLWYTYVRIVLYGIMHTLYQHVVCCVVVVTGGWKLAHVVVIGAIFLLYIHYMCVTLSKFSHVLQLNIQCMSKSITLYMYIHCPSLLVFTNDTFTSAAVLLRHTRSISGSLYTLVVPCVCVCV